MTSPLSPSTRREATRISGGAAADNLVAAVEIAYCPLELPHPVKLGHAYYSEREYVVVRVSDGQGRHGFAYGYTRGLPLLPLLEKASRGVVGTDPRDRGRTVQKMTEATPSARSTLVRATSLLEVALWDLLGKQVGLSLSQMLGAVRNEVPVLPVAGYFRDVRGDEAVIGELLKLEESGYDQIKIMVGSLDTPEAMGFLAQARESLNPRTRLAVDAHYSLPSVEASVRAMRSLADLGVWILEDPFLPSEWRRMAALASVGAPGIAIGEDVSEPSQFLDLLEHATVLRVDPTTCGGVRAAISGIEAAGIRGTAVIPHVFTQLSAQLGSAYTAVACVEHIPTESQSDPIDQFFERPLRVSNGHVLVDQMPGAGVGLDWDRLAAFRGNTTTVSE
ncbi:mandelate racemase/muconate lactonizing enzyme family protein [Paenarthrobacter sp. NPDC057981]|uniref:mandelate racemase/muconate lactonizing enzyme family protein n=1 Tax=Paenarthrobacter sp. NPDC057981 TaxID=3346297 RepID=UPI0036D8EABE